MSTLKSFSNARKAFVANLNELVTKFGYTATTFSMRLNQSAFSSGSTKNVATAEEVASWLAGTKVPTLYAIYKLTEFFGVSIDSILSEEFKNTLMAPGKSWARQSASSPKIYTGSTSTPATITLSPGSSITLAPGASITNSNHTKVSTMATKKNTSNTKMMRELIETRTSSTDYNLNLAYRVLTSDMQLKDIATKVGVSTRSLRDYMYYNTSIDSTVAKPLAAVLSTNTNALGLKLNKETARYEHVK
jgi:methionine-rich copper-binding protein CopC